LFTLLLSPSVGSFIDQQKSRQGGLNVTIIANRTTVLVCCVLWLFLIYSPSTRDNVEAFPHFISSSLKRHIVFAFVIFFGILERLSGVANMLTMERDWVPAIADPVRGSGTYTLTTLNAKMRRIDLICKLFAPLFISAIIEGTSATMAVIFLAASNVFGLIVEPRLADFVFARNEKLQAPRVTTSPPPAMTPGLWLRPDMRIKTFFIAQHRHIWAYFTTNAWLPSLSLALLYFSALSYSATFVTWLLSSGFSLLVITLARTIGSIVEVSSTFVAPLGINRLARIKQDQNRVEGSFDDGTEGLMHEMDMEEQPDLQGPREREHLVGLARSGLWGVMVQFVCLVSTILLHSVHVADVVVDSCRSCNL
jgi:iron-regulated transporter 1